MLRHLHSNAFGPSVGIVSLMAVMVAGPVAAQVSSLSDLEPNYSPNPDHDAQPLVRIPPLLPPRAERSGACDMVFDVGADGRTKNIEANCTEKLFRRSAVKAVEKWVYQPKILNGHAMPREGVKTEIRFAVLDEDGEIVPAAESVTGEGGGT